MVWAVPLVVLVLNLIAAHLMVMRKRVTWLVVLGLAWLALGVYALITGRAHQGFDAIGYAIVLALIVIPALTGAGLGATIAALRRRRQSAATDDPA